MRLEDYNKKILKEFLGLYSRGEDDQVPYNYLSDCLNVDSDMNQWKTRDGLSTYITLGYGAGNGKVRRFASVPSEFIGVITIILDDAGNFYTSSARVGDNATTPRFTVAAATDFSAIKMLGNIYIAVHDGDNGLSAQNLRIFIPHPTTIASDVFREAGGLKPSAAGPMIAANGAAGIVNAGTYKIAVAYVTTSGFITPPGPLVATIFTPTTYVSPGSVKISLSTIPTGPAGTAKRQILITKAGLEEYYFLPTLYGGLIDNNTATTATLDFDDIVDLVDSADYLFDILQAIPSPLVLQDFNGRLITGGEAGFGTLLRASFPGEPETFDAIDGIITVNKDDGFTVHNLSVIRNTLYAWKNLGVFSIRDNDSDPSSWPVNPIDQTVNVGIHGIAAFYDMSGVRMSRDWTALATISGILLFDGIVRKPPLTDFINDIWQTINYGQYHKIVLVIDEQYHKIYCAFPTGANTNNNKFFVGDYNLCPGKIPEASTMKWIPWEFYPGGTFKSPSEIGVFGIPALKFASIDGGGKIWTIDPAATTDDGTAIESYIETSLMYWDEGAVHFFTGVNFRITGTGTLLCTVKGYDNVLSATLPSVILAALPGTEKLIRFNFQNEKAKFKFRLTSGKFILSKVEIFGKSIYTMRPA